MDATQAQQFLRQQLSYAGILLGEADGAQRLPAKRAFFQSAIAALGLGLEQYIAQVLGLAMFRFSDPIASSVSAQVKNAHANVKQDELRSLLEEGAWLAEFSHLYITLQVLPSASSAAPAPTAKIDSDNASQLIASSSQQDPNEHWTQLDTGALHAYVARAEELLNRHSSADQEW